MAPKVIRPYWRRVAQRAWSEALRASDLGSWRWAIRGASFLVGSALYLRFAGVEAALGELLIAAFSGLAGLAAVTAVHFFWSLFATPARAAAEAEEKAERRYNDLLLESERAKKELDELRRSAPQVRIEFDDSCNSDVIRSPFKTVIWYVPRRQPIRREVTKYEFALGVRNVGARTARNVRALMHRANKPDHYIDLYLLHQVTAADRVDIPPHAVEYFVLGYILRKERAPTPMMVTLEEDEMDSIMTKAGLLERDGLAVPASRRVHHFLRNDGYVVRIAVYGDDAQPAYGLFHMDLRDRITVTFEPADSLD